MPPDPSRRTTLYRPSKSVPISPSVTAISLRVGSSPPVQQNLHDLLGDRRRNRPAEAVLVLEDDADRDARRLRRSEADEPDGVRAGHPGLRGAGLACDLDARDL